MGNHHPKKHKHHSKKSKHKNLPPKTYIETLLEQSYRRMDLEFSQNELTLFKLKLKDSENYFFTKFNFVFIFNSCLFQENVTTLYNNFNRIIESFSKKNASSLATTPFHFLIILEDEIESFQNTRKISYESLFTIIFEKLEINLLLYLDFTNSPSVLIREFSKQLCENAFLYKCNRQFGCLYCLLPNTDYVIKNSNSLTYFTNKKNVTSKIISDAFNMYFNVKHIKKLVNAVNEQIKGGVESSFYADFIGKASPYQANVLINVDFECVVEKFISFNEVQFKLFETIVGICRKKVFLIYLNKNFEFNENFEMFIDKMFKGFVTMCSRSENAIKLKFLLLSYNHNENNKNNNIILSNDNNTDTNINNNIVFKLDSFKEKLFNTIHNYIINRVSSLETEQELQIICEVHEIIKDKNNIINNNQNSFSSTYDFKAISMLFKKESSSENLLQQTEFFEKCAQNEQMKIIEKILGYFYPQMLDKNIFNCIAKFLSERKILINSSKTKKNITNSIFSINTEIIGKCNKHTYKKFFIKSM